MISKSFDKRMRKLYDNALRISLEDVGRIVIMSDCHRADGRYNDNFAANEKITFRALKYYYEMGYTYIELGDGDELWENKKYDEIINVYSNIFWMLSMFYQRGRLYMLYGNHDIVKRKKRLKPLLSPLCFHEGIILTTGTPPNGMPRVSLYLTHGHQASALNSTLWPLSRFLVRYVWNPLENLGVLDPTSAAKNYRIKNNCELRLNSWAEKNRRILITGHTHRPVLPAEPSRYYNTGSCVHPRCITCIEIERLSMTLVKWCMNARADSTLYVAREIIAGPVPLQSVP